MNKPNTTLAAALLFGASALGGCATTHIGDDWQCPLTQGSPCLSVASADPAAPGDIAGAPPPPISARSVGRSPAYRLEDNPPEFGEARTEGESVTCNAWCRPFAWLWRRGGGGVAADDIESMAESAVVEAAVEDLEKSAPVPDTPNDLRTPELIGRIWIAPYVDANGVYHEASWVRAVLEPARWRRP